MKRGLHGLKDVWFIFGRKMVDDGWNMAGAGAGVLSGRFITESEDGSVHDVCSRLLSAEAGQFLMLSFRHLAWRFWNQT